MTMNTLQRGFTLLEILVALAIVGLLASIAYPNYADSLVRMRRLEGQAALVEAMQKQELYRARHNTYLAFDAGTALPDGTGMRWWSGSDAASSAYELDGRACEGEAIADCIVLRARPGTARVDGHARDPACGSLSLDSRGREGASGRASGCWP